MSRHVSNELDSLGLTPLVQLITQVAPQIPLIVVNLVGLAVAIVRFRRHTRVSWLAVVGFGLALVWSLVNALLVVAGQEVMLRAGWSAVQLGTFYAGVNIVGSGIGTMTGICIVVALFIDRPPHLAETREHHLT